MPFRTPACGSTMLEYENPIWNPARKPPTSAAATMQPQPEADATVR